MLDINPHDLSSLLVIIEDSGQNPIDRAIAVELLPHHPLNSAVRRKLLAINANNQEPALVRESAAEVYRMITQLP